MAALCSRDAGHLTLDLVSYRIRMKYVGGFPRDLGEVFRGRAAMAAEESDVSPDRGSRCREAQADMARGNGLRRRPRFTQMVQLSVLRLVGERAARQFVHQCRRNVRSAADEERSANAH